MMYSRDNDCLFNSLSQANRNQITTACEATPWTGKIQREISPQGRVNRKSAGIKVKPC